MLTAPVSGMSMNPARTTASAIVANHWMSVWVYFAAPVAGMLSAAEVFVRRRGREAVPCGKMMHAEPCIFCEHQSRAIQTAHGVHGARHQRREALTTHCTPYARHRRRWTRTAD
jgi:aquaporin Z